MEFKFIERVSNADFSYNWPKKGDVSVVEERYVFAGPNVRKNMALSELQGTVKLQSHTKNFAKNTNCSPRFSGIFLQVLFFDMILV